MKTAVHPPHQTDLQYHLCHKVLLLSPFSVHGCVRAQVENKRYGATIRQSVCPHTLGQHPCDSAALHTDDM